MLKTTTLSAEFGIELDRRRKRLRMPRAVLARRCGVSLPTINRVLSGDWEHASFATLKAIAHSLGMEFALTSNTDPQDFAEQQAAEKAAAIARMVQGTSALESQAVDPATYQEIVRQTAHELISGSRRRLWSP